MKILIIGDDINLFVAADAATFRQRHQVALGTVVAEDSTGWEVEAPHITDTMSTLLPTAKLHTSFAVATIIQGTKDGWDEKVADPRHTAEFFQPGVEGVIRAMDYFQSRLNTYGSNLIGLKPSMFFDAISSADLIINTAVRYKVCKEEEHSIMSLPFWWSDTIKTGQEDNTIVLNGDKSPAWYSSAKIAGRTRVKWRNKPPFEGVFEGFDMAKSNCDCSLGGMVHVGPRATWTPTGTTLDTFSDTTRAIMHKEEGKDA